MGQLYTPLREMVVVAREFCASVDNLEQAGSGWLRRLSELLSRVHTAVNSMENESEVSEAKPVVLDMEARFELFSRIHRQLGDKDSYWLEYDHCDHTSQMSGSLADDVTDIYFDLRQGLEWVERGEPDKAAGLWQSSYRTHWGQHLVDASRHLYALDLRNQLR